MWADTAFGMIACLPNDVFLNTAPPLVNSCVQGQVLALVLFQLEQAVGSQADPGAPSNMQPAEPTSHPPLYERLFGLCVSSCSGGDVGISLLARVAAGAAISALRSHAGTAALPEHRGRLEALSASPWLPQDAATYDFVANCGSTFADWEVGYIGPCCCDISNPTGRGSVYRL